VREALESAGPILTSTKAVVAAVHREPAWAIPRAPLEALAPDQRAALESQLRKLRLAGL